MIKFSLKLAASLVLLLSSVAHAGLMTSDLTENDYATIGNLDWAWASSVNMSGHNLTNVLYNPTENFSPDLNVTWRYALDSELKEFVEAVIKKPNLYLSYFTNTDVNGNTSYKQALSFWNTELVTLDTSDIDNFKSGLINSELSIDYLSEWHFETFYVRDTAQVPEPSTIMIFAIALIALSLRKRAIK